MAVLVVVVLEKNLLSRLERLERLELSKCILDVFLLEVVMCCTEVSGI